MSPGSVRMRDADEIESIVITSDDEDERQPDGSGSGDGDAAALSDDDGGGARDSGSDGRFSYGDGDGDDDDDDDDDGGSASSGDGAAASSGEADLGIGGADAAAAAAARRSGGSGGGGPGYRVVTRESLVALQRAAIDGVVAVWGCAPGVAKTLLMAWRWDKDRLLSEPQPRAHTTGQPASQPAAITPALLCAQPHPAGIEAGKRTCHLTSPTSSP